MMQLRHVMIDLETMGLRPTSAMVSIGAVHFDGQKILSEFHTAVNLQSALAMGLTKDQSTVDWWMKQSVEARSSWQREDAPELATAMSQFSAWIRDIGGKRQIAPWGNGADFDLVLMKHAYDVLEADPEWEFWNHHCFRTMKNMFKVAAMPRTGTYHNALDDAKTQVLHLQRILEAHKITLP
jgi:hypothetical protein